jgi:hypothetical protein
LTARPTDTPPSVVDRMLTPADRFGGAGGRLATFTGTVLLAGIAGLVVGMGASSTAAGVSTFIAVCMALAFVLAFSAAQRFREDSMAPRSAPEPRVGFGEPRAEGVALIVPVANEPLAGRAEDLRATIRIESLAGAVLADELPGRWQGSEQASVDLAADGVPRSVEVALTDRAAAEDDFLVWLTATGSNVPKLTTVVRVQRARAGLTAVPLDAPLAG